LNIEQGLTILYFRSVSLLSKIKKGCSLFLNQNIETLDTITFLRNFLLEEPNLKTTHIPFSLA